MSAFVIDTAILIDHLRGFEPAKVIIGKIRSKEITAYISSVTEAEVFSGKDAKQTSKRQELSELIGLFEKVLLTNEIAQKAGELRRNYSIEIPDAIIAATAFQQKCKLWTKNKKDFDKIKEIEIEEPY
ncbi:MAG: type II toxin-antitoxin system VapC family toxin [Candidatus Aenigmarchaeota archaeon]|nr:type II toxin-antitoxin system VapC family toxin [Candidatus Aenigmarchaeota archaeon]